MSKKLSLEEFLGDGILGESVWNEDEINLDAINNTTNLDILKTKSTEHGNARTPHFGPGMNGPGGPGGSSGSMQSPSMGGRVHAPPTNVNPNADYVVTGPPYIIKFSNLPPRFSEFDIKDLFQAKSTQYVKFKLFWELNKNPSIDTMKNGTVFEKNFKKNWKVAFVELFTARDMDKILKFWSTPLKELYNILLTPGEFPDFKEYIAKATLITDPNDDPAKPHLVKELELQKEEKLKEKKTSPVPTTNKPSYSQILEKSLNSPSPAATPLSGGSSVINQSGHTMQHGDNLSKYSKHETNDSDDELSKNFEDKVNFDDNQSSSNDNNDGSQAGSYNGNYNNYKRGSSRGSYNRGGRGNFNGRGGNRGGYNSRGNFNNRGGYHNRDGANKDQQRTNSYGNRQDRKENYSKNDDERSNSNKSDNDSLSGLFKPASDFLRGSDDRNSSRGDRGRGGRGSHRGGRFSTRGQGTNRF